MTTFESLDDLLKNLPNSENKQLSLEDIHTICCNIPPFILTCYAPNLSYESLFSLLKSSNNNEVEITCNVLDKLLNSVDPAFLMSSFNTHIKLGLHHHSPFVVYLCLEQLERVVKDSCKHFEGHATIITSLIDLITSDNASIATKACTILSFFGRSGQGLEMVFGVELLEQFRKVAGSNDIIRFRIYDAIVCIVVESAESLEYFRKHSNPDTNFLNLLLSEMFPQDGKQDILVQLNAIEIVTKLASCQHGYKFLEECGADVKLENLILDSSNNPSSRLLLPGLIKLFGSVCAQFPNLITSRYKSFVSILFDGIINTIHVTLQVAIETIALLASKVPGKMALSKLGNPMILSASVLGELMVKPPTEMKISALNAIQHLLWVPLEEQTPEVLRVVEKWFAVVFEKNAVSEIQSICMQPYALLKNAGFAALNSIATLKVGQKALKTCAGFQEYLLNRRTDMSYEGIQAKYQVVCTLATSPYSEAVFGEAFKSKLVEYQRQGSVYASAQVIPATDRAE